MAEETTSSYERRIAELERRVAALEAGGRPASIAGRGHPTPASRPAHIPVPEVSAEDWFRRGEGWLGRAGIGLLVVGLVLLFRYAVDRGWLTPGLRIAGGLLAGGSLLGAGLRLFPGRLRYRQILTGGGVIILFITGLAASELYALVPGGVTLLFHGAVALVAFMVAVRQRDTVMASIASAGALLPPAFLLQDAVPGPVLWLFLLLVAAWSALLAARHRPGAYDLVALPAAVLAVASPVIPALLGTERPPQAWDTATEAAALAALIAVWLGFAALPLMRSRFRWAAPLAAGEPRSAAVRLLQPLAVTLPLAGLVQAAGFAGTVGLEATFAAATTAFAIVALLLRTSRPAPGDPDPYGGLLENDDFAAATTAAAACAALFAVSALGPPVRFLAVAILATTAYRAAPRLRAPALGVLAHALYAVIAIELFNRVDEFAAAPALDPFALGAAAIAVAASPFLWLGRTARERLVYGAGIYILAHVLLAEDLADVPGALWLPSAAFAVVGSALVLIGLSRQHLRLQQAGLLSLALLVLRLFTYDLAQVDFGVRIVLFIGCGFAFLGLSYRFRGRRAAG